MPKLTNAEVMARSGSKYNPGGHRGRSGENGAGNHKYTDEERRIVDAARAEVAEAQRKKREVKRKIEKHEKFRTKLRQRLIGEGVSTPGRNVSRMSMADAEVMIVMRCAHGHNFEMLGSDVVTSRAKTLCPECRKATYGTPRADARVKYTMRLDEQGMELLSYTNASTRCQIQDRETGETFDVFPGNVDRWKRSYWYVNQQGERADDRRIRFVADDDDHVFVFRGRQPQVKHPFIAELLQRFPVEEPEWLQDKPLTGIDAMERIIQQFLDEGDKVVNLSLNPSWEGAGKYTWGKIPLSKYMKTLKSNWS